MSSIEDLVNKPVTIEYRHVFNDVSVTPWKFWETDLSEIPESYTSKEEALSVIRIRYGLMIQVSLNPESPIYEFEIDRNFQIRLIYTKMTMITPENYTQTTWEQAMRPSSMPESPWKTDFEKELEGYVEPEIPKDNIENVYEEYEDEEWEDDYDDYNYYQDSLNYCPYCGSLLSYYSNCNCKGELNE